MKPLVSSLLLLFFAIAAHAQTVPTVSDSIVVTASSVPEELESTPAAATIITREDIENREARDVAEVLREVPGLTLFRTGSPGKIGTLFIRGGSSKQALVLWNGVEMNNPYFSGYNFGQLSAAGVERVEIVRGPFSALYGSEAVSGVVNVLTTPSRSGLGIDVESGENGLLNASAHGAYAAQSWSAHGTFEHRQDDGFDPNDDFASDSLLGGLTFRPTAHLTIGAIARHAEYDLGIPFAPNAAGTAFLGSPERREEGSESQFAIPLQLTAGRVDVDVRVSESRRDEHFRDPLGPFGPTFSTTDSRMRNARAFARTKTFLGTITVGGEYETSSVDHQSDFSVIADADRTSSSLFIEDRVSIAAGTNASIELVAGLRHDEYDTFGSELSPRVAAAYVRGGSKWRAAYGESFRAPGIGELYTPFVGNETLEAERSRSIEAGYDHYFGAGSNISLTLFHSEYDDLITFGAARFENIQSATTRGIELGASHRLAGFDAAISYTRLDTEDEATGAQLIRRPEHSGSLALGRDFGALHAQLVVLHSGERLDVTDLLPYGAVTTEAYTTADLTLHYDLGTFVPYVKVENATDTRYEEVFGYRSGGRRAILGVRWQMAR